MILNGKCAAPGIAVGRIFVYKKNLFLPKENFIPDGEQQSHLDHYLSVKKEALDELEGIKAAMQKHDPQKAEIFMAHQEIIEDVVINEEIPSRILNDLWAGDWAIYQVYETVLTVLRQTADTMIAERAEDFDDVRNLLLRLWYGQKKEGFKHLTDPVIIAAHDLMPSDTASMDHGKVLAFLTETGGLTSHTAIIAKSYGIPAVMGIKDLISTVKHGQLTAVNADEGTVILDPDEEVINEYEKKYAVLLNDKQDAQTFLYREAYSSDGKKIEIGLNIANSDDKSLEAQSFTDYAGLFRTEFLFMGRNTLPNEEEQFMVYRKILECFGNRPCYLRTLDIGGDKPLSSMSLPHEGNPFLGNRALRFCFSHPVIFKTQLRAALRASVYGNLMLMLPMVGSLDDIRKAKEHINCVREDLKREGLPYADVKTGIMIEIPSIALVADIAAKEVDFASIGSNDLCQYLCAADRMNGAVESYYQSYHPAMLRLIKETVTAFNTAGKPISICGELAADPLAVPLLIGLGLKKLSMGAASVAAVKRVIASVDMKKCGEIAEAVLQLSTASEIKRYLKK
jgi:phosphotransferase system enzyme I (PtsI)